MKVIDIYSKGEYPANVLSNFYNNEFEIDGVKCASMEGFLQSLKYKNQAEQRAVCALYGKAAKLKGKRKFLWKISGNVYWRGKKLKRKSLGFSALIQRAYTALSLNQNFAKALKATKGSELTHSIGGHNKRTTILTEEEFIENLNALRDKL